MAAALSIVGAVFYLTAEVKVIPVAVIAIISAVLAIAVTALAAAKPGLKLANLTPTVCAVLLTAALVQSVNSQLDPLGWWVSGLYTMVRKVYHPLDMDSGDFALAVDEETDKAYIFFERPHFELICATLTDDYTACTGEWSAHYEGRKPPLTREAPTFFTREGKKYLITSGTTGYYPNRSTVCVFDDFHGEYRDLGNPCTGDPTNTTFNSQITSVLRLPGTERYIACADRWMPNPLVPRMSKHIVRKFEKMFQSYVPDRSPKTEGVSGKLQRHMEDTKHSPYVNETMVEKQTAAIVLLAIGYILWFSIAYPFYSTLHASLVSLSTRDSGDRSLLATISTATALAAIGIASMVLPFFLRLLFVYDMSGNGTPVYDDTGAILYYTDASGAALYDGLASYKHWQIFVVVLMIVTALGALVEFLFTRERVTEEGMDGETPKAALPVAQQASVCFRDRFWIIMIAFFFFYQLGGMVKNVSQLYFCQAMFQDASGNYTVANGGSIQGMLAIIGSVPTALGMVVAVPLAKRTGKRNAILSGAVLAVAGGALGLMFPDNLPIVIVSFVVKALGSAPAMQNYGDNRFVEDGKVTTAAYVAYEEGIYVGYRYYETRALDEGEDWYAAQVVYPFGYGLSYTQFVWSNAGLVETADGFELSVTVTNTGARPGRDVVRCCYGGGKAIKETEVHDEKI